MSLTEIAAVTNSNVVLVVVMLDEKLHTDEHPTCNDPACPCHEDTEPVCMDPACPCRNEANYRRLNSDDFIPEYPCLAQETTWYEC